MIMARRAVVAGRAGSPEPRPIRIRRSDKK
jgi:hypothetical protein